jgi:hypothetical protein
MGVVVVAATERFGTQTASTMDGSNIRTNTNRTCCRSTSPQRSFFIRVDCRSSRGTLVEARPSAPINRISLNRAFLLDLSPIGIRCSKRRNFQEGSCTDALSRKRRPLRRSLPEFQTTERSRRAPRTENAERQTPNAFLSPPTSPKRFQGQRDAIDVLFSSSLLSAC